MSWEQHRYAVERARDYRRRQADLANEPSQGVNLQGEANGSDAEMLDEVADFLKSLNAHILYQNSDKDVPDAICDNTGCVVLACCKVCGLGECELDETPVCPGRQVRRA